MFSFDLLECNKVTVKISFYKKRIIHNFVEYFLKSYYVDIYQYLLIDIYWYLICMLVLAKVLFIMVAESRSEKWNIQSLSKYQLICFKNLSLYLTLFHSLTEIYKYLCINKCLNVYVCMYVCMYIYRDR